MHHFYLLPATDTVARSHRSAGAHFDHVDHADASASTWRHGRRRHRRTAP